MKKVTTAALLAAATAALVPTMALGITAGSASNKVARSPASWVQ